MAMAVSSIGLWDMDVQQRTLTLSVGFAELLGYGIELSTVSIGEWEAFLHPDDVMPFRQDMGAHLRGERLHYQAEVRVRHKDGKWVWIGIQGKVVEHTPTGKPVQIIGTASDITLAKEQEEHRERLLTQFRQLTDPLDHGVAIVTHDQRFSYINAAGQNILGMTVTQKGWPYVGEVFTDENWQSIASRDQVDTGTIQQVEIDFEGTGYADQEHRLLFEVAPHRDDAGRPEWLLKFEPVVSQADFLVNVDNVEDTSILTICSKCHDVKTGPDEWEKLALYLNKAHDLLVSHGLCPDCLYEFTQQVHQHKYHRH